MTQMGAIGMSASYRRDFCTPRMVGALAIDQDIMPIATPDELEPQAQAQGVSQGRLALFDNSTEVWSSFDGIGSVETETEACDGSVSAPSANHC